MNSLSVLDISSKAMWVLIKISAPIMIVALGVGLIISLLQALTQIQEQTLTFVPKILVLFITLLFIMPFIGAEMLKLSNEIHLHIVSAR